MSYRIDIMYLDEYGDNFFHVIEDHDKYLEYTDLMREPCIVRGIMMYGIVIDRIDDKGNITRSGKLIPPHRITLIRWSDTLQEDEELERVRHD